MGFQTLAACLASAGVAAALSHEECFYQTEWTKTAGVYTHHTWVPVQNAEPIRWRPIDNTSGDQDGRAVRFSDLWGFEVTGRDNTMLAQLATPVDNAYDAAQDLSCILDGSILKGYGGDSLGVAWLLTHPVYTACPATSAIPKGGVAAFVAFEAESLAACARGVAKAGENGIVPDYGTLVYDATKNTCYGVPAEKYQATLEANTETKDGWMRCDFKTLSITGDAHSVTTDSGDTAIVVARQQKPDATPETVYGELNGVTIVDFDAEGYASQPRFAVVVDESALPKPPGSTPEISCPGGVNLELVYIQERSLSYCGENTCPIVDETRIVKQQAVKDGLFNAIEDAQGRFKSVKVSFSEFVDKPMEPFGQEGLDYCYKFFNSLVPYDADYRAYVEEHMNTKWSMSGSGRDNIENQLDGIISATMRAEFSAEDFDEEGNYNLRLVVLLTDKPFHVYGDVRFAKPGCTNESGEEICKDYKPSADDCQCTHHEYPSIEQTIDVLVSKKANLVVYLGQPDADNQADSSIFKTWSSFGGALADASSSTLLGSAIFPATPASEYHLFDGEIMLAGIDATCTALQDLSS